MKVILLLIALAVAAFSQDQNVSCPTNPGVYYLDGSTWQPMTSISPSSTSEDNVPHGLFTFSKKNAVTYPGAAANLTTGARPKFCAPGNNADSQNVFLVKLSERKGHREVQVGEDTAATKVKVKYREQDLQPVDVTSLPGGAVEITPKQDLNPGQYLLVVRNEGDTKNDPNAGYDFGVKPQS